MPASPRTTRFRFFEAVTATLNELSDNGTVLLVVDDLHWADQPTLLLLRHVLRSTDDGQLGIVAMYIDTEVPSDHRLRPSAGRLPVGRTRSRRCTCEGLSEAAVEELALGWPKAPAELVPAALAS